MTSFVSRVNVGTKDEAIVYYKDQNYTIYHREDGPAYIKLDGSFECWFKDNKVHREDGPAKIWGGNYYEYFLNGVIYSKENYLIELGKRRFGNFI